MNTCTAGRHVQSFRAQMQPVKERAMLAGGWAAPLFAATYSLFCM
jgi:type II secretory pathway component PulM